MVIFRGKGRRNDTPENSHEYLKSHTLANAQIFVMHHFAILMQCTSQICFRDGFMDEQVRYSPGMPRPEEAPQKAKIISSTSHPIYGWEQGDNHASACLN